MSISRRAFLRRAGGAALALPLLQIPGRARAAESFPRRLLLFYTPNGTKKELWSPKHFGQPSETQFTLGPLLKPLERFQDRLMVFDGVDSKVAQEGPGGPHQRGMASLLTGHVIREGDFVGGDGRRAGWGGGMSVDQLAADKLEPPTSLSTVELGVRVLENVPRGRIIYRGPDQPVPPENDPVAAFGRMFGDMEADPEQLQRQLVRRRSVLDAVFADFRRLEGRLAAVDRVKLQQHADALRELERRLGRMVERPTACEPTAPGPVADPMSEEYFRSVTRAQMDLLAMALSCDVTRIGSLQCSTAVNAMRFSFMELSHEGHSLSHAGDSSDAMQAQWEAMLVWYAEQVAYLLDLLDAVPEGDGTLLDNTMVLWVNELSRGNNHSLDDLPFVLAGGSNFLRTGRYLQYDGVSHNDLLLEILRALGVEADTFGDPRFSTGQLAGFA